MVIIHSVKNIVSLKVTFSTATLKSIDYKNEFKIPPCKAKNHNNSPQSETPCPMAWSQREEEDQSISNPSRDWAEPALRNTSSDRRGSATTLPLNKQT